MAPFFTWSIFLAVLASCGEIKDFWYSYIAAPLSYAGGLSVTTVLENAARLFFFTPVNQLLLVTLLGLALLDYASAFDEIKLLFQRHRWPYVGLLLYVAAALFTACRSRHFWPHHAIFFIPPMAYVAAIFASSGIAAFTQTRHSPQKSGTGTLLGLLGPLEFW